MKKNFYFLKLIWKIWLFSKKMKYFKKKIIIIIFAAKQFHLQLSSKTDSTMSKNMALLLYFFFQVIYFHRVVIIYIQITPKLTTPSQVSLLTIIAYWLFPLGYHSGDLELSNQGTCSPSLTSLCRTYSLCLPIFLLANTY